MVSHYEEDEDGNIKRVMVSKQKLEETNKKITKSEQIVHLFKDVVNQPKKMFYAVDFKVKKEDEEVMRNANAHDSQSNGT